MAALGHEKNELRLEKKVKLKGKSKSTLIWQLSAMRKMNFDLKKVKWKTKVNFVYGATKRKFEFYNRKSLNQIQYCKLKVKF